MKKILLFGGIFSFLAFSILLLQPNDHALHALQPISSEQQTLQNGPESATNPPPQTHSEEVSNSETASNSTEGSSLSAKPSSNFSSPQLLQDTPEQTLNSFYAGLLVKEDKDALAPLFYQQENYTPMVSETFYTKVKGFKDKPVYLRQTVNSTDYALFTITYTLVFKDVEDPVPFYDVLPLIKQNGKWYVLIENPTGTPLEEAINTLYNDPVFTQAEAQLELQLQTLFEKYPNLAEALA